MEKINKQISAFGIYQILGGIIGVALSLYFTSKAGVFNFPILILTLFVLSLYSFSVYCGFLLLRKSYLKGLNLSIINQVFQIITFSVLGFTFQYTSGIFLYFGLNLTEDTLFTYNIGLTTFNFKWNSDPNITAFSINIIAIILMNFAFKLREKISQEEENKLSKIGTF